VTAHVGAFAIVRDLQGFRGASSIALMARIDAFGVVRLNSV